MELVNNEEELLITEKLASIDKELRVLNSVIMLF